jgi:hypothetical protein
LLDIGETVREELQAINGLNLSPSQALLSYYGRRIFNDYQAPTETEKAEFLRLQKEYDAEAPPKIERMITLLTQARAKLLGINPTPFAPVSASSTRGGKRGSGDPKKPYSVRDDALFKLIGAENLASLTDAQLRRRYLAQCRKHKHMASFGVDPNAFRCSLYRIRRHHGIPTPKPRKTK